MSKVTIQLNDQLEQALIEKLNVIGMSIDEYVNLVAHQLVSQENELPGSMAVTEAVNDITRRALVTAESKELGIIPDDSPTFSSVEALMVYLDH